MLVAFERAGPSRPTPLIDGSRLGRWHHQACRTRRPLCRSGLRGGSAILRSGRRVEALFERRPPEEVRIILTSTPGDRIPVTTHKRNIVISVADVLGDPGKLAISPQVLGCAGVSRVRCSAVSRSTIRRTAGSSGCRSETLYRSRATSSGSSFGLLFDAYWSGSPVLRTSAVLLWRPATAHQVEHPRQSAFSGRRRLAAISSSTLTEIAGSTPDGHADLKLTRPSFGAAFSVFGGRFVALLTVSPSCPPSRCLPPPRPC